MELVGYVRVSSDGQVDGYGLVAQERAVKAWAKANGHRVVKLCRDEGVSGTLDAHDRPGLRCALATIATGAAGGLVVARLDRLARSLTVQEAALAHVWNLGAQIFSADTGEVARDDPDDPMRTAMRQVLGVFAQLDRGQVAKRLRDGRAAKAAMGRKAVGAYAYGYRPSGKGAQRDAAPDELEQRAVHRIGELRNQGHSYREIARALDVEGLRPRRASSWSAMAIRNVAIRSGQRVETFS